MDLSETYVARPTSQTTKTAAKQSATRGISSKTGEVDLTTLQQAKDSYATLGFNKAELWDQNTIPAYLKRIQYWDSFIKTEREHEKQRIEKVIKINELKGNAKGNPTILPKDSPSRNIYMLLEKKYGRNKLLSSVDKAAENAVKEALPKNVENKGIMDMLYDSLTNLVIREARSNLNAVAGAAKSAENTLISQVGTYVDGKLQSITQGIKDYYNSARNFLMDKLEAGLEFVLDKSRSAMGLDYATYNTVMSSATQEAMANVDNMARLSETVQGRVLQQGNISSRTAGVDSNASYIVNPLESRQLTSENIAQIKGRLQEEATSIINHIYDVIGTGMFEMSGNKEANDYIVMSLMDAAKNRIHTFDYAVDVVSHNKAVGKLMNFADNLRPSNIIGSVLYDNPWGEENASAQNAIGSVRKLMSFNNSDSMDSFIKDVGGDLLNLTGKEKDSNTIVALMDKNIRTPAYNSNLVKTSDMDAETMTNMRNAFGDMADAFVRTRTSGKIFVDVPGRNKSLNPSGNSKNPQIEKLYREICGMFAINETNDTTDANSLSPEPLWGNMRKPSADGRGDVYGLNSLVKSFRVNKYIPSGEIDYFQNGFSHIFFVKPDLNLTQNAVAAMDMTGNPMLGDIITNLNYNNNELIDYWSDFPVPNSDYSRSNNYISYLLSNLLENIPVTDLTLETKDAYENLKGFRMPYGLTHYKNTWGGDITLTFKDTKTLLLNNIFQVWLKYISIMKEGIAECTPKFKNYGYMDYAGAIYGFITEPDGQTITHWFRYTGVFPVTVPFSTISTARSGQDIPEFSVNFKYAIYESNDVNILKDFNYIMNNGPLTSQTGTADELEKYAALGSLPSVLSYTPLSDITLKTGIFPNENHAFVGIIFQDDIKSGNSEIHNVSQTVQNSNSYRFILKYDSSQYFQSGLIGETPTNDTIDVSTGFGADMYANNAYVPADAPFKVKEAAMNERYKVDFGL